MYSSFRLRKRRPVPATPAQLDTLEEWFCLYMPDSHLYGEFQRLLARGGVLQSEVGHYFDKLERIHRGRGTRERRGAVPDQPVAQMAA